MSTKHTLIYKMFLGTGIIGSAHLAAVRYHAERVAKGAADWDKSQPGWEHDIPLGAIDFRRGRSKGKLPEDLLQAKRPGYARYTLEDGRRLGHVAKDAMDLVEVTTLTTAWNMEIAERLHLPYGKLPATDPMVA
jgi:hypothetical protein